VCSCDPELESVLNSSKGPKGSAKIFKSRDILIEGQFWGDSVRFEERMSSLREKERLVSVRERICLYIGRRGDTGFDGTGGGPGIVLSQHHVAQHKIYINILSQYPPDIPKTAVHHEQG
jgi:hypothetical protein